MTGAGINNGAQSVGALSDALLAMLDNLVGKVLGGQAQTKDGKPLRDVCYMQLPTGRPIDPREFAYPWSPAGGSTLASATNLGEVGAPGTPATEAAQLAASMAAARRTAELVDSRLMVTTDGSFRPYQGSAKISDAYQGVIMKAQGVPADPLPADVQARVDAAKALLWKLDANGKVTGRKSDDYALYQKLSSDWAKARTAYALASATAATDPALGAVWPVTSASLQLDVDNAWDDWRSSGADEIENALDTVQSVGGSVGAFYVAQAREVFKAWDLGLTGAVSVGTPYAEISPVTWYDPTDTQNGFARLVVSDSQWASGSASASGNMASNWFSGQSTSIGGGGGGMVFGVTFGVDASHTSASSGSGTQAGGTSSESFSSTMSDVSIEFEWGLCTIERPFLLSELFLIDGWYLPGEPKAAVSDGTLAGAVSGQDADAQDPTGTPTHLLPMITTQFLVIRNVKISASGWGQAGDAMSQWCAQQQGTAQSSSNSVSGGVGFLSFGGHVSVDNADWSGQDSASDSSARSWNFSGNATHGTLSINGCQIAGYIGEIISASPRVDGTVAPAPAHV